MDSYTITVLNYFLVGNKRFNNSTTRGSGVFTANKDSDL